MMSKITAHTQVHHKHSKPLTDMFYNPLLGIFFRFYNLQYSILIERKILFENSIPLKKSSAVRWVKLHLNPFFGSINATPFCKQKYLKSKMKWKYII